MTNTATWRFPDKPVDSAPAILTTLAEGEWLAQLKIDGWRCLIEWEPDGAGLTLTSRHQEPIPASADLRRELTCLLEPQRAPLLIDAEWTGRRDRQPEGLVLFDLLGLEDEWLGGEGALARFHELRMLGSELGIGEGGRIRAVAWTLRDYPAFFEYSRTVPGVEGIVLKRCNSRYVGSVRRSVDNPAWLKVRHRAGEAGQTRLV